MKPILALDVDGVLIEGFPRKNWSEHMLQDLGIDPAQFQREFFHQEVWLQVLRGEVNIEIPLQEFLTSVNSDVTVTEFLRYWHGNDSRLRHDLIDAVDEWRERTDGIVVLATNQDKTRASYLFDELRLSLHVDAVLASCYLGALKPEPQFFVKADEKLDRSAGQPVYFLDDLIANVEAARLHGWQASHVEEIESGTSIVAALK